MVQKLSKAEAGKLGSVKSAAAAKARKEARIVEYNLTPKICLHCAQPLSYENRRKSFCGHSCRATHYNTGNFKDKIRWTCEGCGKIHETSPGGVKKFCNNTCQRAVTKKDSWDRLQRGELKDRAVIRTTLMREVGRHCFECGLEEWRGHPIPLEVDHIDGNAGNNAFDNLRIVCPNCHGITNTWKGRNKGSGRAARGLPLN